MNHPPEPQKAALDSLPRSTTRQPAAAQKHSVSQFWAIPIFGGLAIWAFVVGLLFVGGTAGGLGCVGVVAGFIFGLDFLLRRLFRPYGKCQYCNYDLRGLPQRRCPECGAPF